MSFKTLLLTIIIIVFVVIATGCSSVTIPTAPKQDQLVLQVDQSLLQPVDRFLFPLAEIYIGGRSVVYCYRYVAYRYAAPADDADSRPQPVCRRNLSAVGERIGTHLASGRQFGTDSSSRSACGQHSLFQRLFIPTFPEQLCPADWWNKLCPVHCQYRKQQ